MTDLQEAPAIFQLIRNRDVSINAIRLYLQHYPKSLQYPVHGQDTILTIAVKECFALYTPEVFEHEDINALLLRQLSILDLVSDFVDVSEIVSGQSIFHLLLRLSIGSDNGDEEANVLTIAVYKLISNSILEVLLKHITVSDESSILFLRNEDSELAIHLAILHDNQRAARKLLDHMRLSCCEYSYYEYTEPDRKIPLLHYLLMHSPGSKLISLIFTAFPNAASITDSDGVFPIAVALEHSLPARKIELIISMYPQALSIPNDDGDLPLHLAAMDCPHQLDVLELLIDRCDMALLTPNHNGQLPLHCCLEYQKNGHRDEPITLTTVQILSNTTHRTSSGEDSDESEDMINVGKLSDDSINMTSVNSSPVSTVRSTVSYFDDELDQSVRSQPAPDLGKWAALRHRDSYGEIPLHSACRGLTSCSFEIMSWLLECYPDSASLKNKFGHLPMHLFAAAEEHAADNDTIEQCFELLLKAYPCAIYTQDHEGDIPLQCLLTHSDILPTMMDCFINNMTKITEGNVHLIENPHTRHLPLHTACLNGVYSIDILNQLISLYPEALLHFDMDGLLPFHIALESPQNCTPLIMKTLLYRTPTDTQEVTCQSMSTLPCTAEGIPALFFACEHAKGAEDYESNDDRKIYDGQVLDAIRFLAEHSPEIFATRK